MVAVAIASALAASQAVAQSEHEVLPTPASLTQVLSCQSRDALGTFAELLFLQFRPPAWMRPSKLPKALDGMIGLYGFADEGNVSVFGEPVDHVYFMSDWVVALLPRASAERAIAAQKMTRAPIAITEQYYRFVDPETGPMIGGFAPTGDAMAKMLVDAFGGDPAAKSAKVPPSTDPKMLLVGCNYAVASQDCRRDLPKYPWLNEHHRHICMTPPQGQALSDERLKPDFSLKFIGALGGFSDETAAVDRFLIDLAIVVPRLQPRPLLVPKRDAFGWSTR